MLEVEKEIKFTTPLEIKTKYYKTSAVLTRLGNSYKIRSVQPGEFIVLTGSPLIAALTEKGIDMQDEKARVAAIKAMSDEEKIALAKKMAEDSNIANVGKSIACQGVISLNLVEKSPEETTGEEVSVDLIPNEDLEEIVAAIMEISSTEEEIKTVYTFQDYSKEDAGEPNSDTPDSEVIRSETSGVTISYEEPKP